MPHPPAHFPTLVLFITASIWAAFATWLGIFPRALLTAFAVEQTTPQMFTEVRAFYGGVELAIAICMLIFWRQGNLGSALLVGGLPLLGSSLMRLIGMALDGFFVLHLTMACFEITGAVLCFAAIRQLQYDRGLHPKGDSSK